MGSSTDVLWKQKEVAIPAHNKAGESEGMKDADRSQEEVCAPICRIFSAKKIMRSALGRFTHCTYVAASSKC